MTLSESDNHLAISRRMFIHADDFLQSGDLVQASEKGWGATAHYLKAVAKRRGWRNRSHKDFFDIKNRLAFETDDPGRINLLFREANGLHHNFYEPWYTTEDVQGAIEASKELIEKLERANVLNR